MHQAPMDHQDVDAFRQLSADGHDTTDQNDALPVLTEMAGEISTNA